MQTVLINFAARSLTRDLADRDAHQLRDMGLIRAADGTLRLLDDPSVQAVPISRRMKARGSWGRFFVELLRPLRASKTTL